MTTLTPAPDASSVPFFHTLPIWVLDCAERLNLRKGSITEAKVMAKTADLILSTPDGNHKVKVYRRDAFTARSV